MGFNSAFKGLIFRISVTFSVPHQGVLGPVPPVTETSRADSRAVTYCLEDGRLTFGGWVVVVKE